ncbi:hypothetical protein Scuro_30 [Acinetobacter phage Scuro]|nr:hypothetical protein Scuro_30 [Acinetobacter phage Scuro]
MKSQHLSAAWDILRAMSLEERYGTKPIPAQVALKLYSGDLIPAIYSKRVKNLQRYGVKFFTEMTQPDGKKIEFTFSVHIDAELKLSEFFNGKAGVKTVRDGKSSDGWPGVSKMWTSVISADYPGHTVTSAVGVVNCLVKRGK